MMAGTTTVDAQGRDWAYLAWQATEPQSIRARTFAVYAKPGDAASAALYERRAVVALQMDPLVIQPLLQRRRLIEPTGAQGRRFELSETPARRGRMSASGPGRVKTRTVTIG